MKVLDCAGKSLDLSTPVVMGILNVTPDSFSDGGRFISIDSAIAQAESMTEAGASIIDVGGESTRPGAQPVDEEAECQRVLPVIEALVRRDLAVIISVDTSKSVVMRRAVESGAGLINDVCALSAPQARETVAELGVPVCLMHMQGEPRSMQHSPGYSDVVQDVKAYLLRAVEYCAAAGINRNQIILDPGFGFGKTLAHNLSLLKHLHEFVELGFPVLAGISRKSMLGMITGKEVDERLAASVAAATLSLQQGVSILRVHDVAETIDAIKIYQGMSQAD